RVLAVPSPQPASRPVDGTCPRSTFCPRRLRQTMQSPGDTTPPGRSAAASARPGDAGRRRPLPILFASALLGSCAILLATGSSGAQGVGAEGASPAAAGGEASLVVPPLGDSAIASFFGTSGSSLLVFGLLVCILGMAFGLMVFTQLRNAPVHQSMREISELI